VVNGKGLMVNGIAFDRPSLTAFLWPKAELHPHSLHVVKRERRAVTAFSLMNVFRTIALDEQQ
jgi:hypothetical protein